MSSPRHAQDSPLDDLDQGPDRAAKISRRRRGPPQEEQPAEAPTAEVAAEGPGRAETAVPEKRRPPEETASAPPSQAEEMVVTGSRVKHTRHALPTLGRGHGSQAAAAERREQHGRGRAHDERSTAARSSTPRSRPPPSARRSSTCAASALSSTLVLLNGRRLVQSGAASIDGSNFVDVNTIPMPMVERIEILKGGASAIYGSDAVAGVVNMITRKHVNGFEAQVGGQTTDSVRPARLRRVAARRRRERQLARDRRGDVLQALAAVRRRPRLHQQCEEHQQPGLAEHVSSRSSPT